MNEINASIDAQQNINQLQPLNHETSKSRPLSTYDNLTSSSNSTMFGHQVVNNDTSSMKQHHQISSKNEPPCILNNSSEKLFKFHDSTYEQKSNVDKRKMIIENNNNNGNNNNDDDDNDDDNNDINHHKLNANIKGHLMTVSNNKNSNNNNNNNNINNNYGNTPVACDNTNSNNNRNNSDLSQYKNVGELMKLHRTKILSDARSSFFGLIPTTNVSTPKSSSNTIEHSTMNNPNFCDQIPLISTNINSNSNSNNNSNNSSAGASVIRSRTNEYQNVPSNSAYFNCNNGAVSSDRKNSNEIDRNKNVCNVYNDDAADTEKSNHFNGNDSLEISLNMTTMQPLVPENNSLLSPTQAVYMATTVPQNIKGSNIMGRHKPTRSSLRHSRMIVINKSYQTSSRRNPLNLTYPCLTKSTLIFQILTGICLSFLALWIILWAPNTRTRDNPYWSGLMLVLCGIIGLILIEFRRIPRHRLREHIFTFIRMTSMTITIATIVLAFTAFLLATIHLGSLLSPTTTCLSANILTSNTACVCLFGGKNSTNRVEIQKEGEISAGEFQFEYKDLSCTEVKTGWTYILIISTVLNAFGLVFSLTYLLLICCQRKTK